MERFLSVNKKLCIYIVKTSYSLLCNDLFPEIPSSSSRHQDCNVVYDVVGINKGCVKYNVAYNGNNSEVVKITAVTYCDQYLICVGNCCDRVYCGRDQSYVYISVQSILCDGCDAVAVVDMG